MQKGKSCRTERLLLTFDLNDENQKAVYEVLRTAGYGKRTPMVVSAMTAQAGQNVPADTLENVAKKAAEMAASMIFDNFRTLFSTGVDVNKSQSEEDSSGLSNEIYSPDDLEMEEDFIPDDILEDAVRLSALFD